MSDKEPEGEEIPKSRKKRLKKIVIGLAVFAALLGGSAYFAQDRLINEMHSLVITTLKEVGIHVDYSSARQDPVRGAVIEKVFLYETEKQEKPVLTITNLGLSPSLRQWFLEGELSIRVTLKDSEISMLVDGEEVERLGSVTSVMKAGVSGVTIGHLSAVMNGVDYNVKGRVDFGSGKDKGEKTKAIETVIDDKKELLLDFSFLKPLGEWLSVEAQKGKLHVISDFNIDAADLDGMIVNSQFSGESFVWHGVDFDQMKAEVTYSGKDKSVNVKSIEAAYRGKSVGGELRYLTPTKTLEITRLDSQVDFLSLIKDYSGKSAEKNGQALVLIQAPHLSLSGNLDFGDLKKSDLEVEFLDAADAVVKRGGREMSFKELQGKLAFADGRVSIFEQGINAKVIGGDFNLSGEMEVMGGAQSRSANLTVSGKSFPYHGVTFDHMKANVIYSGEDRTVDVKSFDMAYRGKPLTGEFRYLIPTKTLEIIGLDSQVDFLSLMKDYSGNSTEEGGQEVVLIQAPHLGINGHVEFENLEKSDLTIEFLNDAGAVVETAGRQISMKELKGKLAFAGGSLSTLDPGLSTKIAEGEVYLSGKMAVVSDEKAYQASLKLENISVNELDALINAEGEDKKLPGRLFFDFDGSGDKAMPVKDAQGKVKIEGAKFYSMRRFGSLFATLNKAVPAFGKRNSGEKAGTQVLTGTYQVQDEVIRSDDLALGGDLSQVLVKGNYDLKNKIVNMDGKAEFKGAVGLATGLASNLLELTGTGPLDEIKWKFKNLNAIGVVKAGTKGVTETSKEALKLGGDTAKGAAKITGKSVEGISKGLKKVLPFKKKK